MTNAFRRSITFRSVPYSNSMHTSAPKTYVFNIPALVPCHNPPNPWFL